MWDRRVVIIDLGVLTDSVIAKTIGEGVREVNRRGFLDYIFVARQPDFIATRAWHSWRADLDSDPRFREQYVPIIEYEDQWIYRRFGARKFSGDYVRRELVENHDNLMASFRADSKGVSYPGCIGCK